MIFCTSVHGQMLRGTVVDGETTKPLYPVTITNLATEETVTTDFQGNFVIPARSGDTLSFTFGGYHSGRYVAATGKPLSVAMTPLHVKLPEYVLHEYTPYQKDSIEMATLYSKELNKPSVKVGWSNANGGGFTGLIGGPVQKLSRSYKQNKRFKKNFQNDMEQKYIDTRYTPALVHSVTGLTGDTLIIFMNTHPMEYSFARYGTDLEIKVWISENYKDFMKHPEQLAMFFTDSTGKGNKQ